MIYLYGASGHAKVIIEILEQQKLIISGLIDTNISINSMLDYPVYHELKVPLFDTRQQLIICIGNNLIRKKLSEELEGEFINAIHPCANLSKRCTVQEGTVIMAGVSINSGSAIGKHTILNTNCSIDHDCAISDFVHISPNAALAGNVAIGEGTHIGIGASIIQGIKIGKWATIGAGTVVIKDVPDYAVVVGNPGKVIKYTYPKS